MEYTNDIFLDMLANPGTLNLADYKALGYTPESTRLLSEDEYKRSSKIRENPLFLNPKGEFDERVFHQFYENAKLAKDLFSRDAYSQNLVDYTSYDKHNIFAPLDKIVRAYSNPNFGEPVLTKLANPARVTRGFVGVNLSSDPVKSMDEIAQGQKVLANPSEAYNADGTINLDKAIWHDAPEESFFTDFWDTRVLAQFDEDGTHFDPIEGRIVEHKKGDLRLNENGTYYYENLDGRDVYGRRVLNKLNTLTKEDSNLNTYDFFDSDDLEEKSIPGVIMRNLALVGSMFLPYGIGLGISALSAGTNISGMLAVLGKMLTGSDSSTLSAIEGWSLSWNRQFGKTQYAAEHTWCPENFIDTFSDLIGQLRELRAIYELVPGIIKGGPAIIDEPGLREKFGVAALERNMINKHATLDKLPFDQLAGRVGREASSREANFIGKALVQAPKYNMISALKELENYLKSYNKIGAALSKTYMAGLISLHLYGEAKNEGLSDTEAALVTLGRFVAEEALLNTPLGDYIFPELRYEGMKYNKIMSGLYDDVKNNFGVLFNLAKTAAEKNSVVFDLIKKAFKTHKLVQAERLVSPKGLNGDLVKTAFVMGHEAGLVNDIEEALNDLAKATYNTLNWLGTGHTMKHDENYFDRYAMGYLSGLVGGGITSAVLSFGLIRDLSNILSRAMELFVYLYRNGEMPKFLKSVDNTTIEDQTLGIIPSVDVETGEITFNSASKENPSWDSAIKQLIHRLAQLILDLVEEEHAGLTDLLFIDLLLQKDARLQFLSTSNVSKRYLNYFNNLVTKIVKLKGLIRALEALELQVVDTKQAAYKKANEERVNKNIEIVEELKTLQLELQDLLDGKMSHKFINEALFEMTPIINSLVIPELTTVKGFARAAEGVNYDELTDEKKKEWNDKFRQFQDNPFKSDIMIHIANLFMEFNQKFAPKILASLEQYKRLAGNKAYTDTATLLTNIYLKIHNAGLFSKDLDLADLTEDQMNGISQWLTDAFPMLTLLSSHEYLKDANGEYILDENNRRIGVNDQLKNTYENAIQEYKNNQKALNAAVLAANTSTQEYNESNKRLATLEPSSDAYKAEYDLNIQLRDQENDNLNALLQAKNKATDSFNILRTIFSELILKQTGKLLEPIIETPYLNPEIKEAIKTIINQLDLGWVELSQIKTDNFQEALDTIHEVLKYAEDGMLQDVLDSDYDNALISRIAKIFGWTPEETSSHLTELGSGGAYNADAVVSFVNVAESLITSKSDFDNIKESLLKSLETKTNTDIVTFLKNYSLDLTENKTLGDVFDLILRIWTQNIKNISDITNEDNILELIPEVKRILQLAKASIIAARTDESSLLDMFGGYNAAINELSKQAENWTDLPLLDAAIADVMETDINLLYNKVSMIEDLINANAGRKLETQNRVQSNYLFIVYNKYAQLLNNLEFVKALKLEKVQEVFNTMTTHAAYSTKDPNTRMARTKEERSKMSAENLALGKAIYEWANDKDTGKQILDNEEALVNGLMQSGLNFLTNYQSVLTLNSDTIDDISFFNDFVAHMAINLGDFLKIISELKYDTYCPLPSHENAVFLQVSVHANKPLWLKIINAEQRVIKQLWHKLDNATRQKLYSKAKSLINPEFDDLCLLFIPAPQHASIVGIEGGAGVGKSTGSLDLLGKILKSIDSAALDNVYVVHNTKSGAENNAKALGATKYTTFTHEELMKKIDPNRTLDAKLARVLTPNDYTISAKGYLESLVQCNKFTSEQKPSVIIIDEISLLSSFDLETLGKWADELGVTIFTIGDLKQTGVEATASIAKLGSITQPLTLTCKIEPNQIIHGMKIGVSMRTDNELLNWNNSQFINMFVSPIDHTTIDLRYYLDASTFNGVKIYDLAVGAANLRVYDPATIEAIIKDIKLLIPIAKLYAIDKKRPELAKIGFIFDDTTKDSELRKRILEDPVLKEAIEEYPNSSALGKESTFFIMDINPADDSFDNNFYTGITRAIKGTIVLTPKNRTTFSSNIKLFNLEGPDTSSHPDLYTELAKARFTETHLKELKQLTLNESGTITIKTESLGVTPVPPAEVAKTAFSAEDFQNAIINVTPDLVSYKLLKPVTLSEEASEKYINKKEKIVVIGFLQAISNGALTGKLQLVDSNNNVYDLVENNLNIQEFTDLVIKNPDSLKNDEVSDSLFDENPEVPNTPTIVEPVQDVEKVEQILDLLATKEEKLIQTETPEINPITTVGHLLSPTLNTIFYSFNNFTLGLKLNSDGSVQLLGSHYENRIDDVNGLRKIEQNNGILYGVDGRTFTIKDKSGPALTNDLQNIEHVLSQVWRYAVYSEDKSTLLNNLYNLFGGKFKNGYVTFGLQILPDNSTKDTFAKAPLMQKFFTPLDESRRYNFSEDTGLPRVQLVMIYGADVNLNPLDLLKIPVYSLNSPISVLLTRVNNLLVFALEWAIFKQEYDKNQDITGALKAVITLSQANTADKQNLHNLIKIWLGYDPSARNTQQTSLADIFFINDDNWVPSQNIEDRGPQLTSHKGDLLVNDKYLYDAQPISLNELFKNPRFVRSNIYAIRNSNYLNGHTLHELTPHGKNVKSAGTGHPFIILTNKESRTPFLDFYKEAVAVGTTKLSTRIGWILPPSEDIMHYMENAHNILTRAEVPTFHNLGEITTNFEIGLHVLNYKEGNQPSALDVLQRTNFITKTEYNNIKQALQKYQELKAIFENADMASRAEAWKNLRKFLIVDKVAWLLGQSSRTNNDCMLALLHSILYPKWATPQATQNKTNYTLWINKVFQSYNKPIYYRILRASNSKGNLLLLNPDATNPTVSSYTMNTMLGPKDIMVAWKVDTSVGVGTIVFNNLVNFLDYVVTQMNTRLNSTPGWKLSSDGQRFRDGCSKILPKSESQVDQLIGKIKTLLKDLTVNGTSILQIIDNLNSNPNTMVKGFVLDGKAYVFTLSNILSTLDIYLLQFDKLEINKEERWLKLHFKRNGGDVVYKTDLDKLITTDECIAFSFESDSTTSETTYRKDQILKLIQDERINDVDLKDKLKAFISNDGIIDLLVKNRKNSMAARMLRMDAVKLNECFKINLGII